MILLSIKLIFFFVVINIIPALAVTSFFTKKEEWLNLFDKLIISTILSPFILITVSFVEDSLHLPQNKYILALNLVLIAALNFYFFLKNKEKLKISTNFYKITAYFLFAGIIVSRTLPTLAYQVPILHDPISHSEWLKYLSTHYTTTKSQWYPQGFEYYLNYFTTLVGISAPKVVLVFTNYLSALFSVSVFYLFSFLVKEKNRILPFAGLFVATYLAQPKSLFYTAGKNSFILTLSAIPILLYLIFNAKEKRENFILSLLLFATFIVHYPTGVFLYFFFFVAIILNLFLRDKFTTVMRKIFGLIILNSLLLLIFLVKTVPIYLATPVVKDTSVIGTTAYINQAGIPAFIIKNFYENEVITFSLPVILVFVAAVSVFVFYERKKEEIYRFGLFLLSAYSVLYVLGAILLLPKEKSYGIFFQQELRLFSLTLIVFFIPWIINALFIQLSQEKQKYENLVVFLLFTLILLVSVKDYRTFKAEEKALNTITNSDLAAFNFISQSIHDNKAFLIQLAKGGGVIMPSDGGAWIPSYTDKKVYVNFTDYVASSSETIYNDYLDLAAGKDKTQDVKDLYCKYDIGYIYFGSRKVFANNLPENSISTDNLFSKVYSNGGASVYKINDLNCSN